MPARGRTWRAGLIGASAAVVLLAAFAGPGTMRGGGASPSAGEPAAAAAERQAFRSLAFAPLAASKAIPDEPPKSRLAQCPTTPAAPLSRLSPAGCQSLVSAAIQKYRHDGVSYKHQIQDYSATGDYLNYGAYLDYTGDPNVTFDRGGIPRVKYGSSFEYNPVTIAQYGLAMYGRMLAGKATRADFLNVSNFLLRWQEESGALPYRFDFPYYLEPEPLRAPWVSAMSQGQALSVFARAYRLTRDPAYRDAGQRALEFLVRPLSEGGTMVTLASLSPGLSNFIFFSEYPSAKEAYTLNGFMYTILGLYDWWQVDPGDTSETFALAHEYYSCALATLLVILPRYDIGGFSAYDLGHITHGAPKPHLSPWHHAFHIALLHALESVSLADSLKAYEERWAATVDAPGASAAESGGQAALPPIETLREALAGAP
jgi:hypothetical protein